MKSNLNAGLIALTIIVFFSILSLGASEGAPSPMPTGTPAPDPTITPAPERYKPTPMPLPEPNENRESWTSITSFNTQKLPIILIGGVFIVIIIASVASGILLYRRERHKYVITDKGKDAMNRKIEDD